MLLDELERPDGWQRFSEPWWLEQLELIRPLFVRGAKLKSDFLLHRVYEQGGWHPLFAKFGIIQRYYRHWKEDYANVASLELHTPEWGGMKKWRALEDSVKDDPPFAPTVIYTANLLAANFEANNVDATQLKSLVHWGGGIGVQTLLMRWWGATHTEYIIDLPVMSAVQYEFIRHNYDGEVHLALDDVRVGAINIVPLSRIDLVPQDHDVFLALHSLNESSEYAQHYVADERQWFNSEKLILDWTPSHEFFGGSSAWMSRMEILQKEGRVVLPRQARALARSDWEGDVERLAALYEQRVKLPVLFLSRHNWCNVAETGPNDRAPVELERFMAGVPVIVVDISHVPNRRDVEWVCEYAAKHDYLVREEDEAFVLARAECVSNDEIREALGLA